MPTLNPLTRPIIQRASIDIIANLDGCIEQLARQPGERTTPEQTFINELKAVYIHLINHIDYNPITWFQDTLTTLTDLIEPAVPAYQASTADLDRLLDDLHTATANPLYLLISWYTTQGFHTQHTLLAPVNTLINAAIHRDGTRINHTLFQRPQVPVPPDTTNTIIRDARNYVRKHHTALAAYYQQPTLV